MSEPTAPTSDTTTSETSFDKARIKVLLLEGVHQSAVDNLLDAGYTNLKRLDHALQGDALAEALADVHMLSIRSQTQLSLRGAQ